MTTPSLVSDCVSAIFNVFFFLGVVGLFVASLFDDDKVAARFFRTTSYRAWICIFPAALLVGDTRLYFSAIRTFRWSPVAFRFTPNIRALTSLWPRSDLLTVEAAGCLFVGFFFFRRKIILFSLDFVLLPYLERP